MNELNALLKNSSNYTEMQCRICGNGGTKQHDDKNLNKNKGGPIKRYSSIHCCLSNS